MTTWPGQLRRGTGVVTMLSIMFVLLVGCGGEEPPEAAAHVNGEPIPSSTVITLRDWYVNKRSSAPVVSSKEQILREALSFQIRATLVRQVANKLGVTTPEASVTDTEAAGRGSWASGVMGADPAMAQHLAALSRSLAFRLFPDVGPSDKEVKRAYRMQLRAAGSPWRAHADIAIFTSKAAAEKFRGAVDKRDNFVSVARDHDAIEANEVNLTSESRLHPGVISKVSSMKVGEIAGPVHVKDYWVCVSLDKRQDLPQPTLHDVRPELEEKLSEGKRYSLFRRWLDKQLTKADIEVDEYFGTWNERTLAVV